LKAQLLWSQDWVTFQSAIALRQAMLTLKQQSLWWRQLLS
jgi:hypothetical protein